MNYFSCDFFCKLEDILIKRIWYIFHVFPKVLDIIEVIDTTYQEIVLIIPLTQNKTEQHKNSQIY